MEKNNNQQFRTVVDVVSASLCCFCGCCAAICPVKCITMERRGSFPHPVVDNSSCTYCGLCLKVCPGWSVDFDEINTAFFGQVPQNRVIGHYRNIYVGAVSDYITRYRRTSGGLAKEIAIWGLKTGYFEAVAISDMTSGAPFKTRTRLVYSPGDIENSPSSIYAPVTACVVLNQLKDINGRVGFIGIPCHIHALRKAQQHVPWLRGKNIFAVGLFCSWTAGLDATVAFMNYHNIKPNQIDKFSFRSGGWPGRIEIHLKHQKAPITFARGQDAGFGDKLKFSAAYNRRGFFANRRCLSCTDHLSELADISLGDAWGLRPRSCGGANLILTRSEAADKVVEELVRKKRINLEVVSQKDLLNSQKGNLATKKKAHLILKGLNRRKFSMPSFTGQPTLKANFFEVIVAELELAILPLGRNPKYWWVLPYLSPFLSLFRRLAGNRL